MSRQSSIKYYVNKEKGICVATLDGVYDDIRMSMHRKLNKANIDDVIWSSGNLADIAMKNIPDHLTARATCNPIDTFDEEVGCAIARVRLLQRLYYYRALASSRIANNLSMISDEFFENTNYYVNRMESYNFEAMAADKTNK